MAPAASIGFIVDKLLSQATRYIAQQGTSMIMDHGAANALL
jgi:hypothetical protein